ncbi:Rho GTPase activation protein [Pilobolus umbonatus]|nr:Rho GTPase activation protein [Pilobolus umbonatus]
MRPSIARSYSSDSSMSTAFSDNEEESEDITHSNNSNNNNTSTSQQFFAKLVRDTRSKVEQKTLEINATVQEKLPEWKSRGALYSNRAKETGIEWSRKGKEAVDRWKKERSDSGVYRQSNENSIFGLPLHLAVNLTRVDTDDMIPAIFRRCIEYLNTYGIHEVGIYRIPGSTTTVNRLKGLFDHGADMDFKETMPDPHAVGTLLKMYLRELPDPIIPYEFTNEYAHHFMNAIQSFNENEKKSIETTINLSTSLSSLTETNSLPPISSNLLRTVRSITARIPAYNYCLLQKLFHHLKKVVECEEENRMSISNLAVIFIPTLNMGRALFHCMIEHNADIFMNEGELAGPNMKSRKECPPPLPQKPHKYTVDHLVTDNNGVKSSHNKTRSDPVILLKHHQEPSRNPPPKPHRSPSLFKDTLVNHKPRLPMKPRSQSISSSVNTLTSTNIETTEECWNRKGRVEAIGRQFEIMINNSNKK